MSHNPLIATLDTDEVDVIGDVHGEIDALRQLLDRLGVDVKNPSKDRKLVFVGDLVDRGPDSVAVLQLVHDLVKAEAAHVVLGNHEFNLLAKAKDPSEEAKSGNGWFWGNADDAWYDEHNQRHMYGSRTLYSEVDRKYWLDFLGGLPFALETPRLRVVHAAWDPAAIAWLRSRPSPEDVWKRKSKPPRPADAPDKDLLKDGQPQPAYHHGLAEWEAACQGSDPCKLLTSGPEQPIGPAGTVRSLGGKWRMVERAPWWKDDDDPKPVLFGHYWRLRSDSREHRRKDDADDMPMFHGTHWLGEHKRAFCIDYSIGYSFKARVEAKSVPRVSCALAAMRMPQRELVFHDGWQPR